MTLVPLQAKELARQVLLELELRGVPAMLALPSFGEHPEPSSQLIVAAGIPPLLIECRPGRTHRTRRRSRTEVAFTARGFAYLLLRELRDLDRPPDAGGYRWA